MSGYQEPFFTRGPSPLARLTFFSLAAIAIMIADHRFQALTWVRFGVSAVLNPVEQTLALPGAAARRVNSYFDDQLKLATENEVLRAEVLELTALAQRARLMQAEQSQIDALANAASRHDQQGVVAEIIRDARNPNARKIIVNKGAAHGVAAGVAAIDGSGVVGQVTAVGLLSSEITLTTEKDQSVPVLVVRNGLRAVAIGAGLSGTIDVPYMPLGADIQVGDKLVTSGIDGTYPAGLAVATVTVVEKNPAFLFAKIAALPAAAPNHHRFLKVLLRHQPKSPADATVAGAATNAPVPAPAAASATPSKSSDYPVIDVGTGTKTAGGNVAPQANPPKPAARRNH